LCTHSCLLYSSILFGISSTAAQYQVTWRTASADLTTSRCFSPSRRPCGTLFLMYLFYASALLELILDSVVTKIFIDNLYTFISWYVLWYLDNSVIYMRDLILAHIWLLILCPCKSGVKNETLDAWILVTYVLSLSPYRIDALLIGPAEVEWFPIPCAI
jgi:hypothetical protein